MNIFAIHIISLNGKVLYNRIESDGITPENIITKGLQEEIRGLLLNGVFLKAIQTKFHQQDSFWWKYRNYGHFVVVITANKNFSDSVIAKIGWTFLRELGDVNPQQTIENSYNLEPFDSKITKIMNESGINIFVHKNDMKMSTKSILELPLKYRPLALHLLSGTTQIYNMNINDVEQLSIHLQLGKNEVKEQLEFLKNKGYI